MDANKSTTQTIDEYIAQYPPDLQEILQRIRQVIKAAAPEATEKISYQMPTFVLHGTLVYFAACKNHLGFYPMPSGVKAFQDELVDYQYSKGAIQFPYAKPLPTDLIRRIVEFRVTENAQKAAAKPRKTASKAKKRRKDE